MTGVWADRDVRSRFPGVTGRWARFDGPAGTQLVDTAITAVASYLRSEAVANDHGFFDASRRSEAVADQARSALGDLLSADPAGLVTGPNTTTLLFALSRAVAATLRPGDEIVCTQLDHDANVAPWLVAARESGAVVRMAVIDPATGRLDPDAVSEVINARTRWVAFTGGSNALGVIPPVGAIVERARLVGAYTLVDAVHLTPHRRIDVAGWGCDALVTSPYKWYGPHAGVLWVRPELLATLGPYNARPAWDDGAGRLQTGTTSFEALAGVAAAAEYLIEEPAEEWRPREDAVFGRLLDGLHDMPHVRVFGPADLVDRTPTVSFRVTGLHPDDVARALAVDQVAVWSGNYYALEPMRALGLEESGGAVRAGVARYTTDDDVDRLLAALRRLRETR